MKRALLVGINNYKDSSIPDLQGCVNDVTNMYDICKKYWGYKNEGIVIITDNRATKKAIVDSLNSIVANSKSGDELLFHYSGHGTQVRDKNGDELKDHMDEAICPHDLDWTDGSLILDDDLNKIFSKIAVGVKATVILDSCHSGTAMRVLSNTMMNCHGVKYQNRFVQPPIDIAARFEGDELKRKAVHNSVTKVVKKIDFWSGCKDYQTCADAYLDNSYNGAFTYYFAKHIRLNNGKISNNELLSRITSSLSHNGFDQKPVFKLNNEALSN